MTAGSIILPDRSGLEQSWAEERAKTLVMGDATDPLARLLDPAFTQTTWEYEYSHVGPEIPGVLHGKQLEALEAIKRRVRHSWLFWGNQVGKTTFGAVVVAAAALGRLAGLWAPPIVAWASALTWELWENILLPELLTWLPPWRVIDAPEPYKHTTKRTIFVRADNGAVSRITGKAAEQGRKKYQAARVHLAWLDEEHPEDVMDEMLPRLMRFGGITLNTMTPLLGMTHVYDRHYLPWKEGQTDPAKVFVSHAGLTDNPSIKAEEIADLTHELRHNPAQLAARLSGLFVRPEGIVLPFDPERHFQDLDDTLLARLVRRGSLIGGIDFGLWRFAFLLAVADVDGSLILIEEIFSQRERLEQRARKIHDILTKYKAPRGTPILGDNANPQDVVEINLAFLRMKSPYRVAAVNAEHKIIKTGVERIENLLGRNAFRIRRGIGKAQPWKLGWNASRAGKPVLGSRFLWEIQNWKYPKTKDEKLQKDQPDDATADGADCMAALRYLVMSWWHRVEEQLGTSTWHHDTHPGYTKKPDGTIERRRPDRPPPEPSSPLNMRTPGYRMPGGVEDDIDPFEEDL